MNFRHHSFFEHTLVPLVEVELPDVPSESAICSGRVVFDHITIIIIDVFIIDVIIIVDVILVVYVIINIIVVMVICIVNVICIYIIIFYGMTYIP